MLSSGNRTVLNDDIQIGTRLDVRQVGRELLIRVGGTGSLREHQLRTKHHQDRKPGSQPKTLGVLVTESHRALRHARWYPVIVNIPCLLTAPHRRSTARQSQHGYHCTCQKDVAKCLQFLPALLHTLLLPPEFFFPTSFLSTGRFPHHRRSRRHSTLRCHLRCCPR